MLTPLKNSCFHEFLMNIVFSFIYFEIKVMASIISDNFLSGGIQFLLIGQFLVFFIITGKIMVCLGNFNENYPNYNIKLQH